MKSHNQFFGEPMAFAPICRPSLRPKEALDALEKMGVKDVNLENRLEVRNEGDTAEIVLSGAIGKSWWDDSGISEQEVRDALKSIPKGKPVSIILNSEGGSVKEGLGIYDAFADRASDITCRVAGYALSIASVFPLAAGKVISPKSSIWMIHNAWSFCQGNAKQLRDAADMLETHDEALVNAYVKATGKSKDDIRSAMEKETWMTGEEAVEFGLADETGDDDAQASYRPLHPDFISRCKNLSPEILNAISAPKQGAAKPTPQPTQEDKMNKKIIVALLFEHGIKTSAGKDFTVDDTDAEFETSLKTLAKKEGLNADARFKAIESQLALAEERRVTDKVLTYVEAGKITNDEASIYVAAALKDEKKTLEILDKKEVAFAGGIPVGFLDPMLAGGDRDPNAREGLTGLQGPRSEMLVNIHKEHKTPQARRHALKSVYDAAIRQALIKDAKTGKRDVFAANTYSGTLVTNFLMDGSITDLVNVWANLNAFSIAKDVDPYKPLAVGQLKHTTGSEPGQINPTSFEPATGSTVAPITVTTNWYNQPMRVGPSDLNNGLRMEDLMTKNVASFADAVTQAATAPITAANFTATPLIVSAAAFGLSDSATLQGQLQKALRKFLILDGTYLARIQNQPGFFQKTGEGLEDSGGYKPFGWEGIHLASNWTGAGNNIKGFACSPQAIVRATGLPLVPPNIPGGVFTTTTFEIPGCGAACALSMWFSLASRTMFVSWDIIAGFAAADLTAGVVIASGTPS